MEPPRCRPEAGSIRLVPGSLKRYRRCRDGRGCRCQKGGPCGKCGDGTSGVEDTAAPVSISSSRFDNHDLCSRTYQELKRSSIKPDNQKPSVWGPFHIADGFEGRSVFVAQWSFIFWSGKLFLCSLSATEDIFQSLRECLNRFLIFDVGRLSGSSANS